MTVTVLYRVCVHVQARRRASSQRQSLYYTLSLCTCRSGGDRAANDFHYTIPCLCARAGHEESLQPVTVTVLFHIYVHVQVTRRAHSQ